MLNDILQLLEKRGVFSQIGLEASQQLTLGIVQLARKYDCNAGEILDEIGERLSLCIWCLSAKQDLNEGICSDCRKQYGSRYSDE